MGNLGKEIDFEWTGRLLTAGFWCWSGWPGRCIVFSLLLRHAVDRNGSGFPPYGKQPADFLDCFVEAMHFQIAEQVQNLPFGFWSDQHGFVMIHVVAVGRSVRVFVFEINLAGRHAVAEHFDDIVKRHGLSADSFGAVVDPEFPVMRIAAFMMEPGIGKALGFFLRIDRRAEALVIAKAGFQFRRRVFGQVMAETLAIQSAAKAQVHDPHFVLVDGRKVAMNFFKRVHRFHHTPENPAEKPAGRTLKKKMKKKGTDGINLSERQGVSELFWQNKMQVCFCQVNPGSERLNQQKWIGIRNNRQKTGRKNMKWLSNFLFAHFLADLAGDCFLHRNRAVAIMLRHLL